MSVLERIFAHSQQLLEIGSGTGQHAVFFAAKLQHLYWQTSDVAANHAGINLWIDDFPRPNLRRPVLLDVDQQHWPGGPDNGRFDAVFSANTLHIMSWPQVKRLFQQLPAVIGPQARVAVYGPFHYRGRHTSEGNRQFDAWLQRRHRDMGIRDKEQVDPLARANGFSLLEDNAMPANNRLLVWQYTAG